MYKLGLLLKISASFVIDLAGFWRKFLHNFAMIVLDIAVIIFCVTYFLHAMGA